MNAFSVDRGFIWISVYSCGCVLIWILCVVFSGLLPVIVGVSVLVPNYGFSLCCARTNKIG